MNVIEEISKFIQRFCPPSNPLLLALSGGPDSLALFYGLIAYKKKYPFSFQVAHVDHAWRVESSEEAEIIRRLASSEGIPFHLRKLNPSELQGNLEQACRRERYLFFKELSSTYKFQGVLVGHHRDDQSETVLKRLLEGSHWSNLAGLKPEVRIDGLRILRPLLHLPKKEIYAFLTDLGVAPFEDPTNQDERFMRARMRCKLIPWLNVNFGKNIENSLVNLANEMEEIKEFFDVRIQKLFLGMIDSPLGVFLELKNNLPSSLLEIKYLVKKFCEMHNLFLSRSQHQTCAESLLENSANQMFENGKKRLFIDRQRLFIFKAPEFSGRHNLEEGKFALGFWSLEVQKVGVGCDCTPNLLVELWKGTYQVWLPDGKYQLAGWNNYFSNKKAVDKWWTKHGVPAFLRSIFPVICQEDEIVYEFLSGFSKLPFINEQKGFKVTIYPTPQ